MLIYQVLLYVTESVLTDVSSAVKMVKNASGSTRSLVRLSGGEGKRKIWENGGEGTEWVRKRYGEVKKGEGIGERRGMGGGKGRDRCCSP